MAAVERDEGNDGEEAPAYYENTPLLGDKPAAGELPEDEILELDKTPVKSSTLEAYLNLIKTALGAGVLAFPQGFSQAGIVTGLLLCLLVALINDYSCRLLYKCRSRVTEESKAITGSTYTAMAHQTFGKFGSGFLTACLVVQLFGSDIGYVVFMETVIASAFPVFSAEIWALILLPFLIAICLLNNFKYLAWSSLFGLASIFVGFGSVLYFGLTSNAPTIPPEVIFIQPNFVQFFGVVIFAYGVPITVVNIVDSMRKPKHLPAVSISACISLFVLYSFLGAFGYAVFATEGFPASENGNIILKLPSGSDFAKVVKILVSATLFASFPLNFLPATQVIEGRLMQLDSFKSHWVLKRSLLRAFEVLAIVGIAIGVPVFNGILGVIGALTGSILSFIAPPLIYLRMFKDDLSLKVKIFNWIVVVFGVIGMGVGSVLAVLDLIKKLSPPGSDSP